ncbi:phage antirepressor N-terminal domain-containing protein [Escherichia coli]|nr:phage antirepressor N-terminal domain-containing protein [Escherichia coli]
MANQSISPVSTINVPFHGAELYVANIDNEAFIPMRPIIDGMGLSYQGQVDKLKSRFSKGVREIMIPTKGGSQNMLCLALRKLAAWLQTISPNKVRPEIRDKVIQYQEECDDVLYEYWTKGTVVNPRKTPKTQPGKITAEQQEAIKQLVMSRGQALPKEKQARAMITMWSALKTHFGCTYKEIAEDQFTEALSIAARVPLEGEVIGRAETFIEGDGRTLVVHFDERGNIKFTENVPDGALVCTLDTFQFYLEKQGWTLVNRNAIKNMTVAQLLAAQ